MKDTTTSPAFHIPFAEERESYIAECVAHYSAYPADISALEQQMQKWLQEHPKASSYRVKAQVYGLAAEHCPVKIFRLSPFYHELVSGRKRNKWGFDGLGGWLYKRNYTRMTRHLNEQTEAWAEDKICTSHYFDVDHHCAGYDKMLRTGLRGIADEAQERLKTADGEQTDFLGAVIAGQQAGIRIAERLGEEAARMARQEQDPRIKARLELIADTAPRVPAGPPESFYEALAAMFFYRELTTSMEGLGVSILGHIDRLLQPFYELDSASGRITYEQARDLMGRYLNYTDARWDPVDRLETSTTVVIGGCDAEGQVVANDVTRMIIECFLDLPLCNPKLNARLDSRHPEWYLDLLGKLVLSGKNVLAIFNDEALIPSHTLYGKAPEDARLYVAGGCQEPVLANTEYNDRAWGGITCNTPKLLLCALGGVTHVPVVKEQESVLQLADVECGRKDAVDFEGFYASFIHLARGVCRRMATYSAQGQALAAEINPCPLFSGGIEDCIKNGQDIMAGGARYNVTTIYHIGLGTVIDSLYAVRRVVYEEKRLTLHKLARHLADDFADAGNMGAYLRSMPKFGHGDTKMDEMGERVSLDLMQTAEDLPQGRGGHTEPGYFAYISFARLGSVTGATPDGRRSGDPFSQGMGPSRIRYPASPTDPIRSQKCLLLERMPGCGVLDVYLPLTRTHEAVPHSINSLIRGFITHRGSVLQFGIMDPRTLRDAQEEADKYPNLQVRVVGFTATFTSLDRATQDEIIARMEG